MNDPTKDKESAPFDLERAIERWSKSLRRQSAIEDGDAADLEGYLRDKVEDLVGLGLSEKEAFERAAAEFAAGEALGRDYLRARTTPGLQLPWRITMWKNYLKTTVRNLYKNKGYAFLNIAGMTIGIVGCFFIGLYIQSELSFDKFNTNFDRIYRITFHQVTTIPALAPAMRDNFPEIENIVEMYDPGEVLIKRSNTTTSFKTRTLYASARLFDVFTLPLIDGDPRTALEKSYTAVIDQETARAYFGRENPLGQVLNISTRFGVGDYQITGIMRDVPRNSHFKPHILISLETFNTFGNDLASWNSHFIHSYVLLKRNTDAGAVQQRIPQLIAKYTGEARDGYALQPLADVHLKSSAMALSMEPGSDITYLYIMSFAAFLILLIACANYANLVTAISLKRFREIGVRKVFGAEKSQITWQFLLESASVILIAVVLSALAVGLLIKPAAALFGVESRSLLANLPGSVFLILGIGVISMALAGVYPAVYLSGIRPADVFRRVDAEKPGRSLFRNGLVVVQFAISIFLIIGALAVGQQVRFIRNKDLGFSREQILVVAVGQNKEIQGRGDILRTEMLKIPGIQGLTFSSTLPMNINWRNGFDYEGRTDEATAVSACCCYVDADYCDVFGLDLIAGRGFYRDNPGDAKYERAFIINEAAAKMLRWENPIGKRMAFEGKVGTVVGIMKDFNNLPLSLAIEPVVLIQSERNRRLLSIKVRSEHMRETVAAVKKVWDEFANGWPFEYQFMDETYDAMYKSEILMSRQSRVFSAVALFLTCFGLFGLVSFMAERRTKEIGIRKVLGASIPEICVFLGRGFTKPILLANLIAWPVAYFYLKAWLQKFAYHIDLRIDAFLVAGVSTWMIALIAIMGRSYRAAAANPVESIRNE
ncbi:MAG: ABC transporter permease [Candidatus Aminicenantes bacterium]|nr:ABC transporter permease [Candidatus Aminicenantes bacterium]